MDKGLKVRDLDSVQKQNPGVDAAKVAEALAVAETLKEQGFGGAEYNLGSPFSRRISQPINLFVVSWNR